MTSKQKHDPKLNKAHAFSSHATSLIDLVGTSLWVAGAVGGISIRSLTSGTILETAKSTVDLAKLLLLEGSGEHVLRRLLTPAAEPSPPQSLLHWTSFERDILHAYRREHRLNTPSSFSNPYRQWILSQPSGIGLHSPTMVRRRQARRQSKDQLALAVRKHFNGMGVQENDVIVDFIYKIRHDPNRISKPHPAAVTATK
ncbi:hypothetical protein NM208_g8390 [Fusarium decemcellulare]|uniref:Uncharacterized protein n=1 Tax=Fusarium decemcellulare TaxID=57161 RepID=A0ACC1S5I6_9HYPO|nr:hypothetical protein NM208_g8390 [Fusarium decemcellulare]